jgi:iron complex transport system ATP-binding protein
MTTLELQDITCAYDSHPIISQISLHAQPGEVLALIGPNGVGKSTLLRAMARLMHPAHGNVILASRDIWQISSRDTARQLAFAPQINNESWSATVEQVVALGRAPHRGWLLPLTIHDDLITRQVLELVGLDHLRDRISTELSGGEQQRMVIARVLAQEPSILLLDEPTSHLDLKYQTEVLSLVRRLAHQKGLTVIVSLHDLNLAAIYADRVALLSNGGLAAIGTPAEVLTSEMLSQVYGVPILVIKHPLRDTPFIIPDIETMEKNDFGTEIQ